MRGLKDMNTGIDEKNCVVVETKGSEVGKWSAGLVGSENPADVGASVPSLEVTRRENGRRE
jgi:hypothetical protein